MSDEIRFLQNHLPGLTDGEYEITVEQEMRSSKFTSQTLFPVHRKFSVRGDRIALKPTDVQVVFPPAGSLGDHANVLPHILLHRSTLPWERRADQKSPETPWLALLLFYEGEVPKPEIVSLKDLSGGGAKFPTFIREPGQSDDDKVTVIDVQRKVLAGILPSKEELALLAHVREGADHIITDGKQVAVSVEFAVIISNRLPRPSGVSTAHLVSVEGRYNANGFDYQGAGENDLIRLVSLQSWSFACIDHQQSFKGLLTRLNCEPSVLRLPKIQLPKSGAAAANEYLAQGYLPLWHGLRHGGKTVSWYHSPLAPAENTLTENDHLPARAADELIRYNPATGMFDVSYASAWELGRLLALQSKNFSVGLYNWKRANAQQFRQIEERLIHDSPLDGGSGQEPLKIPPDIADWFKRLSLLEGVPFNYLVPDERLLPPESIRFFQLDGLWIECLLDGAFSIGRVTAADHRQDSKVKSTAANPHAKVSGALMRSEVVSGWPGLLVDGFNEDKKLNLLRMDRLSANILLCLFEGDVTSVDFHLRPEAAHFGLDQKKDPSSDFYKKLCKNLRDRQGDVSGLPSHKIDEIPWRPTHPGTIDVSELAKTIKARINGNRSSFTSAQFAFQMIESSEKVSFHLTAL